MRLDASAARYRSRAYILALTSSPMWVTRTAVRADASGEVTGRRRGDTGGRCEGRSFPRLPPWLSASSLLTSIHPQNFHHVMPVSHCWLMGREAGTTAMDSGFWQM